MSLPKLRLLWAELKTARACRDAAVADSDEFVVAEREVVRLQKAIADIEAETDPWLSRGWVSAPTCTRRKASLPAKIGSSQCPG